MNRMDIVLFLAMVSSVGSTAITVSAPSHFLLSSDLPARGNRTFSFSSPMLLFVSIHFANQYYDTNIRFVDEQTGLRSNAWAAGQSLTYSGAKKAAFPDGRTTIVIQNNNEHVFDDTKNPAIFYFVDAELAGPIYEGTDAIEKHRILPSENASTVTLLSAGQHLSLFDFRFNEGSSILISAGGLAQVEDDTNALLVLNDSFIDSSSWANVPLPIVSVTSSSADPFTFSATTKVAERATARVGSKTIVMSPGYPFPTIPSKSVKYSFRMAHDAKFQLELEGSLPLPSSSLSILALSGEGTVTYNRSFSSQNWLTRGADPTFSALILTVNIDQPEGAPPSVLLRVYTTGSSLLYSPFAALFSLFLLMSL